MAAETLSIRNVYYNEYMREIIRDVSQNRIIILRILESLEYFIVQ